MPRSSRTSQFPDIETIFQAALRTGGGKYRLPTTGKAIKWRQRAYTFRLSWSRENPKKLNPYDVFKLVIGPEDLEVVKIILIESEGTFTGTKSAPKDALETLAEEFAASLKKDEDVV